MAKRCLSQPTWQDFFRKWMESNELTTAQAADRLGVTSQTVRNYCANVSAPGMPQLAHLAEAMGAPLAELVAAVVATAESKP